MAIDHNIESQRTMDFEKFILDGLENIGQFDFNSAIRFILFGLGIIWVFTTYAVWKDSCDRIKSLPARILIALMILPFNFVALIAYLMLRPKDTFESQYWSDLEKRYLQYETREMGDCENCGYDLQPGFLYCPVCSYPVKISCAGCNEMIDRHWNFCPFCQTRQVSVRQAELKNAVKAETPVTTPSLRGQEDGTPTKEPQPRFGVDDVSKRPELREEAPERKLVTEELSPSTHVIRSKGSVVGEQRIDNKTKKEQVSLREDPKDQLVQEVEDLDKVDDPGDSPKQEGSDHDKVQKVDENIVKDVVHVNGFSFPTRLGKYVLRSMSNFGKKINDVFMSIISPSEEEDMSTNTNRAETKDISEANNAQHEVDLKKGSEDEKVPERAEKDNDPNKVAVGLDTKKDQSEEPAIPANANKFASQATKPNKPVATKNKHKDSADVKHQQTKNKKKNKNNNKKRKKRH
jgi:RNA polymerase subunit RPABC4/transcription elongation factor Spt4